MNEPTPKKYSNMVLGLLDKRAELAGVIEAKQAEFRQLIISLDNLDHTIRLFEPDIDLEDVKPKPLPPRNHAFRGEVMRLVLGFLRKARAPMTTYDIADLVMQARGLNIADQGMRVTVAKRVSAGLRHYMLQNLVRQVKDGTRFVKWEMAR